MTEKEAIKYLDNIFTEILIEKELGKEYSQAIKVVLAHIKYYRNGLEREIESKKENILELIEKSKELEKKDKIIDEMAQYIACLDNDETICKKHYSGDLCEDKEIVCWECIKRYFERKVEE